MMFEYRANVFPSEIGWFNTEHVLIAKPMTTGYMEVEFTNGSSVILGHNWKDRDDVARFKGVMGIKSSNQGEK